MLGILKLQHKNYGIDYPKMCAAATMSEFKKSNWWLTILV